MRNGDYYYFRTYEEERRRGELRRHALDRALLEGRGPRPWLPARLRSAMRDLTKRAQWPRRPA